MNIFLTIVVIYLLGCIVNYIGAVILAFFDLDVDDSPGILYFGS